MENDYKYFEFVVYYFKNSTKSFLKNFENRELIFIFRLFLIFFTYGLFILSIVAISIPKDYKSKYVTFAVLLFVAVMLLVFTEFDLVYYYCIYRLYKGQNKNYNSYLLYNSFINGDKMVIREFDFIFMNFEASYCYLTSSTFVFKYGSNLYKIKVKKKSCYINNELVSKKPFILKDEFEKAIISKLNSLDYYE